MAIVNGERLLDNLRHLRSFGAVDNGVVRPAFSEADKVNIVNGIKIMGAKNILNSLAITASNLYSRNLFTKISLMQLNSQKNVKK